MLFDTHAHYDSDRFNADREGLITSLPENGVSLVVNPGCDMESSIRAIELSEQFAHIYAAVGYHPHDARLIGPGDLDALLDLTSYKKVVAVGEIGLDYHYDNSPRDVQRQRFVEQLELAREAKLPVVIHEREAARDTLDIVRNFSDLAGVFHCFSGSVETARQILGLGWYLSFTGVATYKNARRTTEVIEWMPADRIMIETDSPYLAPEPVRGRRNSSLYVRYVCQKVAELRGISFEEAAALTMENGRRFFGIQQN